MSMNVSLPPELEARVRQRVETGMYGSASEVIREALRLFEAYEEVRSAKLESLRLDIARGLDDVKSGRVSDINIADIKQRGRELLASRNTA
jgi:antitoxin ParD1/3/4